MGFMMIRVGKKYCFYYLLLSFIACLLFSFIIFAFYREKSITRNDEQLRYYKYLELDYVRKETSFGIVSLYGDIDEKSYKSFDNQAFQKSYLISSFEDEEYECFGSCYCVDDVTKNERRSQRSGRTVLIRGASYLLASVSSVVAFNLAKDFFSEKCEDEFSSVCESRFVQSEVDDCHNLSEIDLEKEEKEEKNWAEFFCFGYCVEPTVKSELLNYRPSSSSTKVDCGKIEREGIITIFKNQLVEPKRKTLTKLTITQRMYYTARVRFQAHFMESFCKEESVINFVFAGDDDFVDENKMKKKSMCSGGVENKSLENVKCRPSDRKGGYRYEREKKWWKKAGEEYRRKKKAERKREKEIHDKLKEIRENENKT